MKHAGPWMPATVPFSGATTTARLILASIDIKMLEPDQQTPSPRGYERPGNAAPGYFSDPAWPRAQTPAPRV